MRSWSGVSRNCPGGWFAGSEAGAGLSVHIPTRNGRTRSEQYAGPGRAPRTSEKLATEFVLKTLKKRLFSSPAAFLTTLDPEIARQAKRGKVVRMPSISILKQNSTALTRTTLTTLNTTKQRLTPWTPPRCCSAKSANELAF
jgi:hypothetical protein